jgi:hypothetical protein
VATLTLNGTAIDAVGVTQVTWTNDRGGSGTASGTTIWSIASMTLQTGTNVITVTARDATGNTGSAVLTVSYTATPVTLTLMSLTPDRPAPQSPGTGITWTAVASGGTAPYQYKWWQYDGSSWTVLQNWTSSATYTWRPASANPSYRVGVWIRNAGSTADEYDNPASNGSIPFSIVPSGTLALTSLVSDRSAPQGAGTAIAWTANAIGGTAPYQYKWWLFDGSQWTVLRDWSASNTYVWVPTTANASYRVGVWIRNAGSTADAYDNPFSNGSVPFPIQ